MQKWLNRIWVRDTVHDSEKMSGYAYRVPAYPIAPGDKPPVEDMRIATAWQVKSLITQPQASLEFNTGTPIKVRGHAWAGENRIDKVMVSTDFGLQWQETQLIQPSNRYAWSHWETELTPWQTEAIMKYGHARPTIQVPRNLSANRGTPRATSETSFTECLSR